MIARRRRLTVAASAMLIIGFAVAAWAYFTAVGTGSGDATTTTLASPAPVTASASGTGAAVSWGSVASPSGNAAEVSYTVTRSTDASTWVAAGGTCAGTLGSATTSCTDSPASSGDYYYRVTAAFRSWTSQAQTSGTVHVTVCVTATKLVFTSSAQTFAAGSTSGVITVQRQNASGTPGTCGATTVDLSSSSGAGSFRDAGNTATITSVVIPGGSSDATFRYTDTVVGTPSVTATDHAAVLTQASQTQTVTAGTAAVIRVETAANGSGTVVPAQNVIAGSSITVYSISRDTYGNFVSNVAADTWSLPSKTGGVVDGDLVAAGNLKSATFTGHHVGTATIRAAKSGLVSTDSGTITVVAGTATQLRVETVADGSGTVVPAQNVTAGNSITVYSISRDSQGNFLANVATDASGWSLANVTGGVVSGDLVAAGDLKSAIFTGHLVGSAKIHAVKSGLTSTDSGTITVIAGSATAVRVETAANGSGTVVPAQNVTASSSITVFSITRDTYGNFVANVAATAWSLPTKTGGVVDGDLVAAGDFKSATFTGHLVGNATIRATSGVLAATDTGTITVAAGSATQIRVETVANGTGTVVPAQSVTAGSSINVFAISRDSQGNFVANVATDAAGWSLTNITGGVVSGDLVAAGDLKSATFTGHLVGSAKIHAVKGGLTSTDSGTITVVAGSATKYVFTTAAQTLTAGNASAQLSSTITVQLQDAGGNPVNAASNTSVGLSSTAAPGVFRDTADSATITSITMTGGTNSVTFKYRSTLAGSQTLTAHTAGLTDGTQAEFVNSAPVSLSWNCPSGTVGKTQTITVTISVPADAFGNAFTRNTALAVTVSLTVNDNSQYTVGGSTTSTTVNITTGPATNTFTLVTASGSNKNATVHASVGAGFTAPADSSMKTS